MEESQRDEAFAQLFALEETHCQRDEAEAQHDDALACIAFLQQKLNKYIEELRGMTLAAEESRLQQ